jgi:hypothetical protein
MRLLRACIVLLVVTGVSCGCTRTLAPGSAQVTGPSPEDLERVPVVHLLSEDLSGSAVCLSPTRLLTCRHVLAGEVLEIDGRPTVFEVIANGTGDGLEDDWAVVELTDLELQKPSIVEYIYDGREPEQGWQAWLIGFPAPEDAEPSLAVARSLEKRVIPTRVHHLAGAPKDGILYLDSPRKGSYHGCSGGAVMVWDPDEERLRFLGTYAAGIKASFLFFSTYRMVPVLPEGLVGYAGRSEASD